MTSSTFKNPDARDRILPFWFWNGTVDQAEIAQQIGEMAEQGVGGFFICARQGLTLPYLSAEWFERVRFATEQAAAHGLEVWLYDEYPYPSGIAGGEVILEHPDAKHRILKEHDETLSGPCPVVRTLPWARVLSACAVPVDEDRDALRWEARIDLRRHIGNQQTENVFQKTGLTSYNQKRYFTYAPHKQLEWQVPPGRWRIIILLDEEIQDFKYYGTFVDPCHAEAIASFIRLTHQRYADTVGEHLGTTIKGMFTDEIGFLGKLPWSPRLEPFFQAQHGVSLAERLAELLHGPSQDRPKLRYDYFQAVHLLLRQSYHQQVRSWCDRHALRYIAEVPGARMSTQRYSHIPAGDSAHEKIGRTLEWIIDTYAISLRHSPKMVSSLARQLGIREALIECFHSVGWSMTLQDAKWMIDRMAALGINMFNFHAFFYTLNGLTKYDAPPSQFYQNPYWPHFRQLADYAARVSYTMRQGAAEICVAVLDPTTSLWTHLGNPFHDFAYAGSDEAEKQRLEQLKGDWAHICKTLLMHKRDYDHLDPELLSEADVSKGHIRLGTADYAVLVLPPMTNLETSAWAKIQTFLQAGGTVIALGLLPYEIIDPGRDIEQEMLEAFSLSESPKEAYWQAVSSPARASKTVKGKHDVHFIPSTGSVCNGQGDEALIALLDQLAPPQVRLEPHDDRPNTFLLQHRTLPEGDHLVFVTHQEDDQRHATLELALPFSSWLVESLDLESGDHRAINADTTTNGARLELTFAPYQSHLLRFHETTEKVDIHEQTPWRLALEPTQAWSIHALKENVLRLDTFELSFDNTSAPHALKTDRWATVSAKTLIDQCADITEHIHLPLVFKQQFGTPMRLELAYPLRCWYRRTFTVREVPEVAYLLMDEGAISGDAAIYLNGARVTREAFEPFCHYDHCNRRCPVSQHLVQGTNTLHVRVEASRDWDGLVEPLYLTGAFGVHFGKDRHPFIGSVPERATLTRGFFEGYPFYAGTLSFQRAFRLEQLPDATTFELGLPDWLAPFHDCAEILVNGRSLGVRCWSPYRWMGELDMLKVGENKLELKVTNTLVGMLEGKVFNSEAHALKEVAS